MNTSLAAASIPTSPPSAPASDAVVGDIEQFLHGVIAGMEPMQPAARVGPHGRPRILPALALWGGLLVCVLRGWSCQSALWRLLSTGQFWFYPRFPVSDQAVCHRLERDGTAPLERLWEHLSAVLRERLAPFADATLAAFATEVVALDQVKLDQVARWLPALRGVPPGDDRLLPGAIGALFDLRRQQWRKLEYHADPHQNEKVAARGLVESLPPGSLVLADLGYFSPESSLRRLRLVRLADRAQLLVGQPVAPQDQLHPHPLLLPAGRGAGRPGLPGRASRGSCRPCRAAGAV